MTETVVTQESREAAAQVFEHMVPVGDLRPTNCRLGNMDDGYMVQAFARFEQDTRQASTQELVEALAKAIGAIADDSDLDEAICCSGHECGCRGSSHRELLLHDLRATLTKAEAGHG